jgi:ACT domain-containing protein
MTTKISIERFIENFYLLNNKNLEDIVKDYIEKRKRLSKEKREEIYRLVLDIEYSRDVCRYLGIKYWDIRVIDEIKIWLTLVNTLGL